MERRLTLALCLAAATLAACQGSTGSDASVAAGRPTLTSQGGPGNFNALSQPGVRGATRRRAPAQQAGSPAATVDARLGLPGFLWNRRSPDAELAGGRAAVRGAAEIARAHLKSRAAEYGLTPADVDGAQVTRVRGDGQGATVVRFRQRIRGVDVFREHAAVILDRAGRPVAIAGSLAPSAEAPPTDESALDARDAVALALADLTGEYFAPRDLDPRSAVGGWARFDLSPTVAAARGERFARPARAKQVWFRLPDRLEPAWQLELGLDRLGGAGTLNYAYVLSSVDGRLLFRANLTQEAAYRVFADAATFAPLRGPQGWVGSPHPTGLPDGFQAPFAPALDPVPAQQLVTRAIDPWLPAAATETIGNNVEAHANLVGDYLFDVGDVRGVASGPATFDYAYDFAQAPSTADNTQAAIAQLFYTVNYLHDWFYDAGFDEAAGNAQLDNFGRGGVGADPIIATLQNWWTYDSAQMTTFPDGESPVLEMFLWWPNAERSVTLSSATFTPPQTVEAQIAFGFGDQDFSGAGAVTGSLVLVDDNGVLAGSTRTDGCQTPWVGAPLTGKIALLDSSALCAFSQQAANAQANGAAGVIFRNVAAPPLQNFAPMGGTNAAVTIPALLIDLAAGDAVAAELALGNPVTATMVRAAAQWRDGALDTALVAHEWAHYLTKRIIGNATGLDTNTSLGLAEGWSDFVALLLAVRAEDAAAVSDFAGAYALGAWALGGDLPTGGGNQSYYFGSRRVPYSTDFARNALTYRHFADGNALPGVPVAFDADGANNSEVHNAGEVWATMLWECYAGLLRDTLGATPRLTFAEAQDRMKRYLVTSLELTPVSPTLLEARDALLAAAWAGDPKDLAVFWRAFARRGAGDGAAGPDRWDADNGPIIESFVEPPDLRATRTEFGTVTTPCDDGDGVLDLGEAGTLVVTLENVGPVPLAATTATVSSSHPGITLPSPTVTVGATALYGQATVQVPVSLSAAAVAEEIQLYLTFLPGHLTFDRPVPVLVRVNHDELASGGTSDGFETAAFAWTPGRDPALSPDGAFSRVAIDATDHQLYAQDLGAPSDLWLTSPPLQVGDAGLSITFRHRHDFEAAGGVYYDGGVVELSADGGRSWTDIGAGVYSDDLATTGVDNNCPLETAPTDCLVDYPGNTNPLRGRPAFLGRNLAWPLYDQATIDLGSAWNLQTVLLRFRVGSDTEVGAQGWWIDDVTVSGLASGPFPSLLGDRRICSNGFPNADAGAPQTAAERSGLVTLQAGNVLGAGETYAWVQTAGPTVTLSGANAATATFTAPEVTEDAVLAFQLTVSYGTGSYFKTDSDVTTVTVTNVNRAPTASTTGTPTTADEGAAVTLEGGPPGSFDPDGTPLVYQWVQIGGSPVVFLRGENTAQPTFIAPQVPPSPATQLTFRLTVGDGPLLDPATATATQDVTITIQNVNAPPLASTAGTPAIVDERTAVTLDASGSSDPDGTTPLYYQWSQLAGPVPADFTGAASARPTFTAPEVLGTTPLVFEVTVGDGPLGDPGTLTATAQVVVDVANVNRPPTAVIAGLSPRSANERTPVVLDGSGSGDVDGYPTLTYSWSSDDPLIPLDVANTPLLTFIAPEVTGGPAQATFTLEVCDEDPLACATASVVVFFNDTAVNSPPVALAGSDQSTFRFQPVMLDARGSYDPDGSGVTFLWEQISGAPTVTLSDPTSATPIFTAPDLSADATLVFQLTASDGSAVDTDVVAVVVTFVNRPPVASVIASPPAIAEGGAVTLTAAGATSDPDVGAVLTYAWQQTAGPAVELLPGGAPEEVTFLAPAVARDTQLVFQVTATDQHLAASTATVVVVVADVNNLPVANAGSGQQVAEGALVELDGSASSDLDGTPLSHAWTQLLVGSEPTVVLLGADSARPAFVAPQVAADTDLTFRLTVSDGVAASSADVVVRVLAVNAPPTLSGVVARLGGVAVTEVVEGEVFELTGSATDADPGTTLEYVWTQQPGGQLVSSSADPTTTFMAPDVLVDTTLHFRLAVSDGAATTTADLLVLVRNVDHAPVASAGADQLVDEFSPVRLDGSGSSDADGFPELTFSWTQVVAAGDPVVTLDGADTRFASFIAPAIDGAAEPTRILVFNLEVSDGTTTVSDQVAVTVRDLNRPPVAVAGPNQVSYRDEVVTLDASQSYDPDPDATLTFTWAQLSGTPVSLVPGATPGVVTFVSPSASSNTDLVFRITVSDGMTTVTDFITVTVHPTPRPEDTGGCSCASGTIDPSIAALFPLGLLFRRRRRSA